MSLLNSGQFTEIIKNTRVNSTIYSNNISFDVSNLSANLPGDATGGSYADAVNDSRSTCRGARKAFFVNNDHDSELTIHFYFHGSDATYVSNGSRIRSFKIKANTKKRIDESTFPELSTPAYKIIVGVSYPPGAAPTTGGLIIIREDL